MFDPACVSTKTKAGRFLTSMVLCQPFAKRQCVSKQFTWKYQTYIKFTICGNMYGVREFDHFLPSFREMIPAIMELEPRLAIFPYPDHATIKTGRPFLNNCSMLSNSTRCRIYVDKLYVGEGKPTTVKLFVGHNTLAAVFNSLEFAQKADELDGAVCMCTIQASKVVEAGYLLDSSKMMDDIHWRNRYNNHPRLLKMDVQIKSHPIPDPTGAPWSPKSQVHAAHILCCAKIKEAVNIQMGGMYNKKRKAFCVAANLPERRPFRFIPFEATNKISQTTLRKAKLKKSG